MLKNQELKKHCEQCGKLYFPKKYQYDRQKYCSLNCKWKQRGKLEKEAGIYKGGYSRETHIRLWLDAKGIADTSAPCHYCGDILYPDIFVIEHKIPRKKLKTREKVTDITNLVISCHKCNNKKGKLDYNDFIKREKWHMKMNQKN